MMLDSASIESAADPSAEVAQLRLRLAEAEAVLQSIRSGAVDAVMVGDQVYTLTGAQEPWRRLKARICPTRLRPRSPALRISSRHWLTPS